MHTHARTHTHTQTPPHNSLSLLKEVQSQHDWYSRKVRNDAHPQIALNHDILWSHRSNFQSFLPSSHLQWRWTCTNGEFGASVQTAELDGLQGSREETKQFCCNSGFNHGVSVWFCLSITYACRTGSLSLGFKWLLQHHYLFSTLRDLESCLILHHRYRIQESKCIEIRILIRTPWASFSMVRISFCARTLQCWWKD
jgi:hypothetical protein